MSNSQSQQEVFKSDQYFWCHEGKEHIANWVAVNAQDHPHLYATYINDANAVLYKKRMGKSVEHDKHIIAFLESYPMSFSEVVEQFTWYKANILEKKNLNGVGPNMTGLVDVRAHGSDIQVIAQARDLLYKQVFDIDARHHHWVQRGKAGLLNPKEIEPLTKKQKAHTKSQKRWAKMDEKRASNEAAGPTGEVGRLMTGLKVSQKEGQGKADEYVEMDG